VGWAGMEDTLSLNWVVLRIGSKLRPLLSGGKQNRPRHRTAVLLTGPRLVNSIDHQEAERRREWQFVGETETEAEQELKVLSIPHVATLRPIRRGFALPTTRGPISANPKRIESLARGCEE